jgi:hypothetical protein
MEWFTILLSSLITVISPVGLIIDTVVADTIRSQVAGVEELAVRIDNTPSYQAIQGKVDRISIASRGVEPIPNLRIELFELETDPININLDELQKPGGLTKIRESLREPLQGAFHVIIKEDDINKALQAPNVKSQLQKIIDRLIPPGVSKFEIINLQLEFLEKNRLGITVKLQQLSEEGEKQDELNLNINVGFQVKKGRSIELLELTAILNDRKISQRFIAPLVQGFNEQLDLETFEKQGVIARILQLNISEDTLDLAAFVRLNPATEP